MDEHRVAGVAFDLPAQQAAAWKDGLAGWIPLGVDTSPQPVLDAVRSIGAAPESYGVFVSFIEERDSGMVRFPSWIAEFAAAVHCPIDVSYTIV